MVKIRKYANIVERMLRGEKGQRFFNFAYSIGAAIVIWGALFKILHLPGGNTLLCIGMGTEVMMFILTAFDRPPKEYAWEEVFPELEGGEPRSHRDHSEHSDHSASASEQGPSVQIVGGPAPAVGAPPVAGVSYASAAAVVSEIPAGSQPAGGSTVIVAGGGGSFGGGNVSLPDIEAPVEGFREMVEAHGADYHKSMAALNLNILALNQL